LAGIALLGARNDHSLASIAVSECLAAVGLLAAWLVMEHEKGWSRAVLLGFGTGLAWAAGMMQWESWSARQALIGWILFGSTMTLFWRFQRRRTPSV
jgi:hypothetical protein